MGDELMELSETRMMRREAAAAQLRELADQLSRHNQVEFVREGLRYSVRVPDEVELKLEIEIGGDGSEIEIEISW
jgi:amphi-Trp domain-containing protein